MRWGPRVLRWWRHAALAGGAAGLAAAPHLTVPAGWLPCTLAGAAALVLAIARLGAGRSAAAVLAAVAGLAALAGLGAGGWRLASIDGGAMQGTAGERVRVTGWVTAPPRRSFGEVRVQLDTKDGRVVVVAPEPVPDLTAGRAVAVRGALRAPDDFRAAELERLGADYELDARRLAPVPGRRGGAAGAADRIRARAESALGVGLDPAGAALARGFVLGQDDRIDPVVRDQFRRAGLSHLLAVSGQNVVLLAVLAGAGLALFGISLRPRLVATIGLIAVYVVVAGAGPSIQRAGVMGIAAILTTLAGRLPGRAYPPLLAAVATLLVNPRFAGDVGWQLSFAAVVGIMLWAGPARDLIAERLPANLPRPLARGLADGTAMTLAATVATAPLIAHDFERISLASIPANLLVLPAIGPVMWLGMLIGMLGQMPGLPIAPLGHLEGVLIGWVALVARVFGTPGWAEAEVPSGGGASVILAWLACSAGAAVTIRSLRRRRRLVPAARAVMVPAACTLAALIAALASGGAGRERPAGLRVTGLDVGQGDALLLEPPRGDPVLVDAGPPGGAANAALERLGVGELAAVFVTHDQLDHAGGLEEVLGGRRVGTVVRGARSRRIDAAAAAAGARLVQVAEGSSLEFGRLRIDVLWPPRDAGPAADPNAASLVLAVGWRGWDVLLTGDAEAEQTHLATGPFDVLKVAHHGSEDAGLSALLERSVPRVALIEVGAGNPYGHPAPATLSALAEHGVCILRTDLDGDVAVEIGPAGIAAETAEDPGPTGRPGCAPSG